MRPPRRVAGLLAARAKQLQQKPRSICLTQNNKKAGQEYLLGTNHALS